MIPFTCLWEASSTNGNSVSILVHFTQFLWERLASGNGKVPRWRQFVEARLKNTKHTARLSCFNTEEMLIKFITELLRSGHLFKPVASLLPGTKEFLCRAASTNTAALACQFVSWHSFEAHAPRDCAKQWITRKRNQFQGSARSPSASFAHQSRKFQIFIHFLRSLGRRWRIRLQWVQISGTHSVPSLQRWALSTFARTDTYYNPAKRQLSQQRGFSLRDRPNHFEFFLCLCSCKKTLFSIRVSPFVLNSFPKKFWTFSRQSCACFFLKEKQQQNKQVPGLHTQQKIS